MTKKSRRSRRRSRPVRLSSIQMAQPRADGVTDTTVVTALARPASEATSLREEYRYVIADLERIGVIAVAMLAILIVLALLLT